MFVLPCQGQGSEITMINRPMLPLRSFSIGDGWPSGLDRAHGDRYTKVGAQQFPSWVPTVALDHTAQGQDGLPAGLGPDHPGLLHALSDQGFAGGFDNPTGNRQTLTEIFGVVHALVLIAKVSQLGLQSFSPVSLGSPAVILQHPNRAVHPGLWS
jgi:hypothetical protein